MKTTPTVAYTSNATLSESSLRAMEELGVVLKSVYLRIQRDGYKLKDGQIVRDNENEQEDTNN